MRKGDLVLVAGLSEQQCARVVLLLSSMGVDFEAESSGGATMTINVAAGDAARARMLLNEEFPMGASHHPGVSPRPARDPFADAEVTAPASWLGRGSTAVIAVCALCVGVFVIIAAGPEGISRSRLIQYGAITWNRIEAGEYWRLAAAIFIHFDAGHLLSNMVVLMITAPPLAHMLGPRRFLLVFLVAGVAANMISHELAPTLGLKAGASGAIAGVLGALGGQALRPRAQSRYRAWHRLGALAAFYAMLVGFGPGRDNVAHLAGLLVGLALGRLLEPEPMSTFPTSAPATLDPPR